jgi:hypothetical protein
MSDWTEYHPGLDWPKGDNIKWQNLCGGKWHDIKESDPKEWWEYGHRVRYRILEVKTRGQLADDAWKVTPIYSKPGFAGFRYGFYAGWQASRENPEVE